MANSGKTTETETGIEAEAEDRSDQQEAVTPEGDAPEAPPAPDETPEDLDTSDDPVTEEAPAEDAQSVDETDDMPEEPVVEDIAPPAPAPGPEVAPAKSGGGFLGGALVGIIAAGAGFLAAQYPGAGNWPFAETVVAPDAALTETLDRQNATIAELQDRVAGLSADLSKLPTGATADPATGEKLAALETTIGTLSATIDSLTGKIDAIEGQQGGPVIDPARMDALEARLTELESRPAGGADLSEAVSAYESQLEAMRSELAAQRAANEEMSKTVAAAADAAQAKISAAAENAAVLERRSAMMRIDAALETGGEFAGALAAMPAAEVPPALKAAARDGVATLSQLQTSFDDPAREALAAALRAETDGKAGEKLSAFLRTQMGVRSVTPREGDDPDAVLSRAQAAVNRGDLAEALTEIAALAPEGQVPLADWTAAARARLDALEAADAMAAKLNLR